MPSLRLDAKADISTEKVSNAKSVRLGLDRCLAQFSAGDVLVVWRLDRLGRSIRHLIELLGTAAGLGSSHCAMASST